MTDIERERQRESRIINEIQNQEFDVDDSLLDEESEETIDGVDKTCNEDNLGDEEQGNIEDDDMERSWDWFLNLPTNWKLFFVYLLPLVIFTASWNTHCNQLVRKLTDREKELIDLRHRMLYTTAELVNLERINSIEQRIKVLNLPLEHSTQPPYIIYVDTLTN